MDNRQLDVLIAERVMLLEVPGEAPCWQDECSHWHVSYLEGEESSEFVYLNDCVCEFKEETDITYHGHIAGCLEVVPFYSTDLVRAWSVVERVMEKTNEFILEWQGATIGWYCWFANASVKAQTVPLAICRAALNAMDEE
jgi:hypothetical protein